MSKITVKHSSIHISDYIIGDCYKLENIFSIYDKLTHQSYMKILDYDEKTKILRIPRGLDVNYIEYLFNTSAVLDTKCDPYDKDIQIGLKFKPRDNVQTEALQFLFGHGKYAFTKGKSQLSLNLSTGKGKSYCSITALQLMQVRGVVMTSAIGWLEQWKDYILQYTDIQESEICMLIGSGSIHRIMNNGVDKYKVILASYSTLRSYGERYGWDKITKLFQTLKTGCKIFDECHLNFDTMAKIDMYTNTAKTFYVSATPARSDADENVIFKYYFKNVPSIELFDPEEDPHANYIAIRYSSKPNAFQINGCMNTYGFDKNKYCAYVIYQDNFYRMLTIVMDMVLKTNGKVVFYIATNNSIQFLYNWIFRHYPELRNDMGIYTSIIDESIKQAQLNNKLILSTTKSLGTAADIKGLKMVVNVAEPFRSKVTAQQTFGRLRDKDTLYIDLIDTGFRNLKDYFTDKLPVYNKYALSIKLIEINQRDLDERYNKIIYNRSLLFPPKINPIVFFNQEKFSPIEFTKEKKFNPIEFI